MLQPALLSRSPAAVTFIPGNRRFTFRIRCDLRPGLQLSSTSAAAGQRSPRSRASVLRDSLRVLEWDKVCDAVASFAGTLPGRDATKELLWRLDISYDDSKGLLAETAAAAEMIKYGAGGLDLGGIDAVLVKSAIDRASRGLPVNGIEAIAISNLLEFAEALQMTVKTAIKEDSDWYNRFMPIADVVLELIINRPFIKSVQQVIDEDGSVKDSASSELRRARDQVRGLEQKVFARAKYSLTFGGSFPELSAPGNEGMYIRIAGDVPEERTDGTLVSYSNQKRWKLYLRKAYHPLLLKHHKDSLEKARKDVTNATSEIRRTRLQGNSMTSEDTEMHLATLKLRVDASLMEYSYQGSFLFPSF